MALNKILVVDDDQDILEVLKFLLRKNGYDVILLSEAKNVIETVKETKPDIALLDVNLSGYDGREVCRYLKTVLHVSIPILLFSANATYKNSHKEYGADDFIEKPFEAKRLLSLLISYLPVKV